MFLNRLRSRLFIFVSNLKLKAQGEFLSEAHDEVSIQPILPTPRLTWTHLLGSHDSMPDEYLRCTLVVAGCADQSVRPVHPLPPLLRQPRYACLDFVALQGNTRQRRWNIFFQSLIYFLVNSDSFKPSNFVSLLFFPRNVRIICSFTPISSC